MPPTMPGSAAEILPPIAFDLEKAKQLLADSAFPEGFATTLVVAPLEEWGAMAVYVQEALREIGIEVNLAQRTWDDEVALFQAGDYEGMVFYTWAADFPDASAMLLPLFHSRNVPPQPNLSFYRNPEVDGLLDASETALDEETRWQLLAQAQTLIAADQPMVWVEYPKQFWAMNVAITGYTVSPLWPWDCFTRHLHLHLV
ncbi:MAG: ABC transporter substrate-binding protein [Thermomicrobiales bacterium]